MSGSISIKFSITGHEAIVARLKNAPDKLNKLLKSDLIDLALDMRTEAASRAQGPFSKSGNLENAIQGTVNDGSGFISIILFTEGVPYAHAQEEGATYAPRVIFAAKAEALSFVGEGFGARSGDVSFFNHVNWPGATIPAKRYILNTIRSNKNRFEEIVRDGATKALEA